MKEKLMELLRQQHLLWVQRASTDPELHMTLVLNVDCLPRTQCKLLEDDAQAVLDLILGKETS